MAKIDRVEDLPGWFDLEKYSECESFGAAEWLHELTRRAELMSGHPDNMEGSDEGDDTFREIWAAIWKSTTEVHAAPVRQCPIAYPRSQCSDSFLMPVRGVRVFDLAMQAHRDEMARREGKCGPEKVNRWKAIGDSSYPLREAVKVSGEPIDITSHTEKMPSRPVIQVDLRATDSVLMGAFSAWLKEARAKQPTASKRERPAYKDWARYGLLPYLDLRTWAMETGNQIPHHVISQAVGYRKGGDSFRKTVPKLADELMRDLTELEALAAVEACPEQLII